MAATDKKSNLDISSEGNAAVIAFTSAYISDVEEISGDSAQIRQFINKSHPQQVIFDFSGVKFFSSQVLGLLLEARAQLKSCNGQVVVCTLDPRLHRVFKITNLDRIFPLYPDRSSALDAIAG
jgi:anti-anti-sigma factor